MGDGQHIWAAAEWIVMIRNCFLREEAPNRLIVGQGIPADWLDQKRPVRFGPAPTRYGVVSIVIEWDGEEIVCAWEASWHGADAARRPIVEVRLAGYEPREARSDETEVRFGRARS